LLVKNKNICLFVFIAISIFFLYIIYNSGTITSIENEDGFVRCCFSFFLGATIFGLKDFINTKPKLSNILILIFLILLSLAFLIKKIL